MNNMFFVDSIYTLNIYSNKPLSKLQNYYLEALKYLFSCFKDMQNDNNFCMSLQKSTYLLASHKANRQINPIVFVNEKNEIMFNVDIKIFDNAITEFEAYIKYYDKNSDLSFEEKIKLAIKDYKNDKLDFYSNSKLITNSMMKIVEKDIDELEK